MFDVLTTERKFILLKDTNVADTTKETYGYYFKSLFNWSERISTQEEFLSLPDQELQILLEGFVAHLNKRVKADEISPNTVPKLFKPFKLILDANYREHAVKWKPISVQYPPKEKRSGYKPWTTEQISIFLGKSKNSKEEAMIHFQASTGSRVGVHNHPLLMKHIVKMKVEEFNYPCYAILVYAEADETISEKDQRITNQEIDENDYSFFVFLTPEASKSLDDYHDFRKLHHKETFTDDTPIFTSINTHALPDKGKYYQMNGNAFRKMFQDILDKTSIKRKKKRNRYDTMLDHAFRKRFNTILKLNNNVNTNIAEKLMQHKRGLDGSYLTPTREECFTEFVKAIPELTVSPTARKQVELEQKEKENSELQKINKKYQETLNEKENLESTIMDVVKSVLAAEKDCGVEMIN